jgi:hypothetical protein
MPRIRRRPSIPIAFICLVAAGISVAGCGDDSGDSSTVDITATDFAYDMPDEVTGGLVTMNMVNEGVEPHEYGIVRSDGQHSAEELTAAIDETLRRGGEPPKWVEDVGSFGVQTAGVSSSVTRDFEPGNYAFVCFIPGPGNKNHLELGMRRAFTVSGDSGADAPDSSAVVTATKDGFEVPPVPAGESTLEVRNEGAEPFDFALVRFNPGKDVADVEKWFQGGLKGEAPATLHGGAGFAQDESVFFSTEFESGATYEFVNPQAGDRQKFTVD